MKRTLLLITALLMCLTTVSATTLKDKDVGYNGLTKHRNRFAQPIMFVERGIEFLVFPDGSFDFNTTYNLYYNDDQYYRTDSRRSSIDVNYRGQNVSFGYSSNNHNYNPAVYISRDHYGQVRRVGNVYINYNWNGQVSRVGSVYITYGRGRNSTLTQVGGLRVNYNVWGEIASVRGEVNRFQNGYCNLTGTLKCDMRHDHGHRHDNDWYEGDYDDNYYYYKSNGKVKKHKKMKH